MTRKIILTMILAVSLSAAAFQGYRYITREAVQKEPEPTTTKRTDLFAIQELMAVLRQFQGAKSLEAEFTTVLLSANGDDMGSFKGAYVKDPNNFYIRSIGSENLLNKDYFIAVDQEEKKIYVEKPEVEQGQFPELFQMGFLSDIDSLVKLPDSIVYYEQLDAHTAKLSVEWESAQYYKTEIIYDIETKALKRLHLYPYQDVFLQAEEGEISALGNSGQTTSPSGEVIPEYVAIIYHSIRINEPVSPKWFDAGKYFKKQDRQLIATKSYQNYEIDFE